MKLELNCVQPSRMFFGETPELGHPMQQPNNPRQFSVFSAMATAPFFSGALNRDVARNWRGIGLRLLLLVLVITWIAAGIKMDRAVKHFANDEFPGVVQDFPPITIKDGVVSSPVDQPYYMKDKQTGKTFAVLDTTGTITSLDQADNAILLLTENKIHYRDNSNPGQVKIQDLSKVKNFYVDRTIVTNWVAWGSKWASWVLIPIALVFSFIYRLIQGLIYGAIGMIFNNSFNALAVRSVNAPLVCRDHAGDVAGHDSFTGEHQCACMVVHLPGDRDALSGDGREGQ